ncbi:MAG: sigma-70 family RNA polymerase sigma factor [Byssovorax sp.]
MTPEERAALEAEIRGHFDRGDLDAAMTAAITGYGDELFGFLVGLSGSADRASDVWSALCERLWIGLPGFRWESSFRVWAYTAARHEHLRAGRRASSRARREVPLSAAPSVQEAIDQVRSRTASYLRTDVKDAFARVREELEPDDHVVLGLRLDRGMAWSDIARVLGSEPANVARDAAALRKRFERLKQRLRALIDAAR